MATRNKGNESKALKQARKGKADASPAKPASGETHADVIAQAQRLKQILQYRIAGATLEQIADKFDLTAGRVHQIITKAIADIPKTEVDTLRTMECERLDAMQMALWGPALKGDVGAVSTILSIMNRRARYLGLDVAEQIDLTQKTNPDDARRALLAKLIAIKERAAPMPALTGPANG